MTGNRGIPATESVSKMIQNVIEPLSAATNGKFMSREGKEEAY